MKVLKDDVGHVNQIPVPSTPSTSNNTNNNNQNTNNGQNPNDNQQSNNNQNTTTDNNTSTDSSATLGVKIANYALSKQGSRYYWGAQGPTYFDCSGLVYWAHNQAGVK